MRYLYGRLRPQSNFDVNLRIVYLATAVFIRVFRDSVFYREGAFDVKHCDFCFVHFGIIRKNAIIVHPMLTGARYFTSPRGLRFEKNVFYGSAWASLAPSRAQFDSKEGQQMLLGGVEKCRVFSFKVALGGSFLPHRPRTCQNESKSASWGSFWVIWAQNGSKGLKQFLGRHFWPV